MDPFLAALQHQIQNKSAKQLSKPAARAASAPKTDDDQQNPIGIGQGSSRSSRANSRSGSRKGFRRFRKGKTVSVDGFPRLSPMSDFNGLIPTVRIVEDRHRLDVSFAVKPPQSVRDVLLAYGWNWSAQYAAWIHKDCDDNRAFLAHCFVINWDEANEAQPATIIEVPSATITDVTPAGYGVIDSDRSLEASQQAAEDAADYEADIQDRLADELAAKLAAPKAAQPAQQPAGESYGDDPWSIYKRQVDELCAHMSTDPTTLGMLAVNELHKKTFNRH